MTHTTPRRARNRALMQATPVAAAVAALLYAGSAAHAQTAPATAPAPAAQPDATPSQTITVTGIRRGIESAISTKKNADGVVEAISAEDIGKLPDTTLSESLARLPGVTTQRDRNGNGTIVNIRGLDSDFAGYLLNGREQSTTGDSRGVDLSVYPAELIGGATVYKTADASLMTAGLSGVIDTRLVDPLAFGGRVLAANVNKTKTGVGLPVTGSGKRYSFSYIDQFADRTLGLAIGFVHSDGTSNSLANGSWSGSGPATLTTGVVVPNVSVPFGGGLGFESDRITDKRDGLAAVLVYKPNKAFSSELDIYNAKIKTATKKVKANAGNFTSLTNATIVGGVVQSGTFAMAPGGLVAYSENIFDDDTIESLGWKSTLKFSDNWSGSLDFNHNSAKRIEKDIEVYGGIAGADTLSFTNGGANIPQFTLGNAAAYVDPTQIAIRDQSGWSGVNYPAGSPFAGQTVPQAGYDKGPTITDKIDGLRMDFKGNLPDNIGFTDIQFGANYSKRSKDRITDEGLIVSTQPGGYGRIAYPGGAYVATNVGGTGLNLLTFDPTQDLWPGATLLRKYNNDILSKTWTVTEKVTTVYAKANIDTTLAGVPVSGNAGVQLVNTDQSSAGYRAGASSSVTLTNPASTLSTDGVTYTDFLPALNLKGDLGGGNVLRLGLGKQMARPNMTAMRNAFSAAVDLNTGDAAYNQLVGSAGNPRLKPFKATSLDFSYEKYFGNAAYLSAAAFYKKLDTYITQETIQGYDFTSVANQLGIAIPTPVVVGGTTYKGGPLGIYTTSVNGTGGNISGIELTASVPLKLVLPVLDGFGIQTSYSNTSSSVNLPNLIGLNPTQAVPAGNQTISLPGLSKVNAKFMLYYERSGFSAFVAQNYRSTYVGTVSNTTVGGYPSLVNIAAQVWVSAQVGYEFQTGMFKGLGFRFEGNNMNKPIYREINSDGTTNNTNQTGATYAFKLNYKYQ